MCMNGAKIGLVITTLFLIRIHMVHQKGHIMYVVVAVCASLDIVVV